MAPTISHLTQFSLISRQVVHSLHHLTWIRGIFAAGGHSQCGLTTHMTQLQSVFAAGGHSLSAQTPHLTQLQSFSAAGGNNMALPMSHLTRFSLCRVRHSTGVDYVCVCFHQSFSYFITSRFQLVQNRLTFIFIHFASKRYNTNQHLAPPSMHSLH